MNKLLRFAAAVITAVFTLSGVTAFALSSEPSATATETVIEDSRTLTPKGNADLIDNVSENENLQFITVTARDGNIFYFVIDHAAENENVYFLNTVDESDLAALVEDGELTEQKQPPEQTEKENTETETPTEETEKTETEKEQTEQALQNNNMLLIILILICGGGIAFYYFKVIMPKKKLEQADDIDDFEFEDEDEIEDYNPEEDVEDEILEDSIVYDDSENIENE